jgi:proline iminopeptidase
MTEYYKKHVCRDPKAWESKKSTRSKPNEKLYQKMWGPSEFCATGSLKGYNGKPLLKQINIPVLFISGQYDEATPQSAKNFSKMLKEGYFKEIKQASHSSLREKKTETLKAFKTFFHKANI